MFISCFDSSVRATGRWVQTHTNFRHTFKEALVATAPGSSIEIAFSGKGIVLQFDLEYNVFPMPHLYLSLDGGPRFEVPLDRHIRVDSTEGGNHVLKLIYKSCMEMQHRWTHPLTGKITFLGYDADGAGILPEDCRKTIEFVGDSITEGVLIDAFNHDYKADQENRPAQDDACATYAWLTAEALNLRSYHFAYGAVGITTLGCGGVPNAVTGYPYCFDGCPVQYDKEPDFILINHGANDRGAGAELYIAQYEKLLRIIRSIHPNSKIIALSAFVGFAETELKALIDRFNEENGDDVFYIESRGWVPAEPLHPLRDGHKIIAERLTAILREKYNL